MLMKEWMIFAQKQSLNWDGTSAENTFTEFVKSEIWTQRKTQGQIRMTVAKLRVDKQPHT